MIRIENQENAREQRGFEGLCWLGLALVLRLVFLSRWSLWGDEAYSYINAIELGAGESSPSLKAYPLFFVLELAALKALTWTSLEFTLRVIPAVAGALAVWVLFVGTRGFLNITERRFLALIAATSPWLLFHSQFARFYSLLLLLCAAATFQFLRALQQDSWRRMAVATILFPLAILCHPTAAMLLAGVLCAGLVSKLISGSPSWRTFAPTGVLFGIGLVAVLVRWSSVQTTIGYRLTHKDPGADSVFDLIQGTVYNLGLAISTLVGIGWLLMWKSHRRLAVFILVATGIPFVCVFGLAVVGSAVEQRYLIPVVPLLLIPAAVCLRELRDGLAGARMQATLITSALVLLPFIPGLASHYIDGNRHNLRGATELITEDLRATDMVVAENNFLTGLYLPELPEERLVEAPPQFGRGFDNYRTLSRKAERCWVIVPAEFLELGGDRAAFHEWVWQHGKLVRELYEPRWDYHQNRLQVFLVDLPAAKPWKPVEDESVSDELRALHQPAPVQRDRPPRRRPR